MGDFSDFLQSKLNNLNKDQVNWEEVRIAWLEEINQLYIQFTEWINELDEKKIMTIMQGQIEIDEENLGRYHAPVFTLTVGSEVIRAEPVGRIILGARGRIDLVSVRKKFLLLKKSEGWIFAREDRIGGYLPLTKKGFELMLRELLSK